MPGWYAPCPESFLRSPAPCDDDGVKILSSAVIAAVVLASFTTVMAACSSSTTDATSNGDAGSVDDGATNAPDDAGTTKPGDAGDGGTATGDGGACNALVNAAPESTSATVKGTPPAATGGTIAEGTYYQTEFVLYDPSSDASPPAPGGLKATLVIKGNVMNSVIDVGDGVDKPFTETFTTTGTALDRQLTCPKVAPDLKATYSVDGKKLVVYETDPNSPGVVAASVFMRQ